jgi:hypothetical protein
MLLKELEIKYRITKDLVWKVNEEILSVKLDQIVKVYLYDSAWGELRALHKITDIVGDTRKPRNSRTLIFAGYNFQSLISFLLILE